MERLVTFDITQYYLSSVIDIWNVPKHISDHVTCIELIVMFKLPAVLRQLFPVRTDYASRRLPTGKSCNGNNTNSYSSRCFYEEKHVKSH